MGAVAVAVGVGLAGAVALVVSGVLALFDFQVASGVQPGTNLALDLRVIGLPQAVDSQWCGLVKRYTVSRIRTRFTPLGSDKD